MSGLKRTREKTAEIQRNMEVVYKDGFQRAIIKSEESGKFIGVYYISPEGEYLKNMNDVLNWLNGKADETQLTRSNFNFISKKLSDGFDGEFIINKDKLPEELVDFVLEKKKSIAPEITTVDNDIKNVIEPLEKKLKLDEDSLVMIPKEEPVRKQYPLEELVLRPHRAFQVPLIAIGEEHIFEVAKLCHSERLVDCLKTDFDDIDKQFRPFCNSSCAFDLNGVPRVVFECDICLILWHTDCSGHRWMTGDRATRLIVCDNCSLLQKSINTELPNTFCDTEKLFRQESKLAKLNPSSKQALSPKLVPIFKLCQLQWNRHKSLNPNQLVKKSAKSMLKSSDQAKPNPRKHVFKMLLNYQNVVSQLHEEAVHIKYNIKSVDLLSKIFADLGCRLLVDDQPVQVFASKITLRKGEIFIPINAHITKPSKAVFYTIERDPDLNLEYVNRCEELKTAMITSFYSKFENTVLKSGDIRPPTKSKDNTAPVRAIQITPINNNNNNNNNNNAAAGTTANNNCYKIIASNRLFLPPNTQSVLASTLAQIANQPTLVKLRQRKQDFGNQKIQSRVYNYIRNNQPNLVNLPFLVLERILSCPVLSTQDKLNCRVASRVLKCIVDGGIVWRKMVINPDCVSGLDNMWNFFHSKIVKKITFLIDFQESFGMEFLLSFISRMKLFPDYMGLEKFSVKITGSMVLPSAHQLSVHDILSCCKFIKVLSISSENPTTLAVSKKIFSSHFIEKLKLKNIQNVYEIIQCNGGSTPNLKTLHCGDWSFTTSVECLPLTNVTTLKMYISESVSLTNSSAFSQLVCLENLSISEPIINTALMNLLIDVLKPKYLHKVVLRTLVSRKDSYELCYKLSCCFPKHIAKIYWEIKLEHLQTVEQLSIKVLYNQIQEILPTNVMLHLVES